MRLLVDIAQRVVLTIEYCLKKVVNPGIRTDAQILVEPVRERSVHPESLASSTATRERDHQTGVQKFLVRVQTDQALDLGNDLAARASWMRTSARASRTSIAKRLRTSRS